MLRLVYREIRGLHQAAYILALFAFGSQLLALVRDRLLAHVFGAGIELDLYYAAFRVPDLFYVLFASVLSVYVLLPFVNRSSEKSGVPAGRQILSQLFTLFLVSYSALALVLAITAPWYVPKLFPGFVGQYEQLVMLLQILLLQPFLLGLSSLCGVVTQLTNRFVLYAISPLLYNIGIILGIVAFYPLAGLSGLAYGVLLGAFCHLLVQVPFIRASQYSFTLVRTFDWKLVFNVLSISIPRALTLSINQIVLLVLAGMASVMTVGSVAVFQFAFNLQSVPLAIIGMSYSVAAFPTLSSLYAKKDNLGFNLQLQTALRHIIFWSLPVIGLVIVLRAQIVRVLLGSGAFDWEDTRLTAAVLAVLIVSLLAQAVLLLLVRAFYAGGRTLMPLLVSLGGGVLSIVTALWFSSMYERHDFMRQHLDNLFRIGEVAGSEVLVLAIAFMIGQIVQLLILLILSVSTFRMQYNILWRPLTEGFLATIIGAVVTYATLVFVVDGINQETFIGIVLQGGVAGVAGIMAVIFAYKILGSQELEEVRQSLKTKLFRTDIIKQ